MSSIILVQYSFYSSISSDKYITLEENKEGEGPFPSLHAYPNIIPKLSMADDGADIFMVHAPGANNEKYTVSLESVKFVGYFLQANNVTGISLKKIESNIEESK